MYKYYDKNKNGIMRHIN